MRTAVPALVVMGVSGSGKTTVAHALAAALGWPLVEGDDFHGDANRAKMRTGTPLTDEDRDGWLTALGAELQRHESGVVLTCSALKRTYRQRLRDARPGVRFLFLDIAPPLAASRVQGRGAGHFFPAALVDSQFAALEPPTGEPDVLRLDAAQPVTALVETSRAWLERADEDRA